MESIAKKYINDMDICEAILMDEAINPNSVIHFVEAPVRHFFTPKMYIREIFMPFDPTGTVVLSKTHLTTHPYNISKGRVMVCVNNGEWVEYTAPYNGITQAGTRRALIILEDTVWTTYHPIDFITGEENNLSYEEKEEIANRIGELILDQNENKYVGGNIFNNKITKTKSISQ